MLKTGNLLRGVKVKPGLGNGQREQGDDRKN
jgi:hypothetical protein